MTLPKEDDLLENKNSIIFNASKGELFKLNDNYKIFQRKLKLYYKIIVNKLEISPQVLKDGSLLILPASQDVFLEKELESLKSFIQDGGKVLVLLNEGNPDDKCNINILLETFGIIPNMDCLVRTHYYKYFHPKECYIADSDINPALNKEKSEIKLVYPFGCTMSVSKPSVVAFTSGIATFPVDRSLGALYYNEKSGGRLVAIGSGYMFSDKYLDQENNEKFRNLLFEFLTQQEPIQLIPTGHDDIDLVDHHIVPDVAQLAEKPKLCLTDAIGHMDVIDYTKLFDFKMYSMNTNLVPEALQLYKDLDVKHEPLKIITPKFEAPYPPLLPAVFPPSFRELPPPPLELFDLDEAFSSVFSSLTQYTHQYTISSEDSDKDLEGYISGCAKILNIDDSDSADEVLYKIGEEISKFKSIDTIK